MISLVVTTTNRHKFQEIMEILDLPQIGLLSLHDFDKEITEMDVVESGITFQENAAIKAREYYNAIGRPVLADDSGLEVPALNNEPGVYSARYAGAAASYTENNTLLLSRIKDIPETERNARFVCTICYKDAEQEAYFTGITEGIIIDELRGEQGFGYDPLFYVPEKGRTFAEMNAAEKNALSHRGKAIRKLKDFLVEKYNLALAIVDKK